MKEQTLTAAKGFCIGLAAIIPGVSGGTMALIMGIYTRLLDAIKAFDLTLIGLILKGRIRDSARHTDLSFLMPLGIGVVLAVVFFTRVVPLPTLIKTQPELVYGLFFGLIGGSIIELLGAIDRLRWAGIAQLLGGIVAGLILVNLVPVNTPDNMLFIFISGMLAITAMILPGVSGSFILLVLHKYATVFDAIGRLDMAILMPFFAGLIAGTIVFSRVLSWLFHHYYQQSMRIIIGVITGSLWVIWPFQQRLFVSVGEKEKLLSSTPVLPEAIATTEIMVFGLMLVGLAAVIVLSRLSNTSK